MATTPKDKPDQAPAPAEVAPEAVQVKLIAPLRQGQIMRQVGETISVRPNQVAWLRSEGKIN